MISCILINKTINFEIPCRSFGVNIEIEMLDSSCTKEEGGPDFQITFNPNICLWSKFWEACYIAHYSKLSTCLFSPQIYNKPWKYWMPWLEHSSSPKTLWCCPISKFLALMLNLLPLEILSFSSGLFSSSQLHIIL